MTTANTTIKVPVELRDRLRKRATEQHQTQAEAIEALLRQAEQAEFLDSLSNWEPDEEYRAEAREWDQADLAPSLLSDYPEERIEDWT